MAKKVARETAGFRPVLQLLSLLLLMATPVYASAASNCSVLIIKASNEGKGIDEKLSQYSKIFQNTPFSAFDSFTLTETQATRVELEIPVGLRLPDSIDGSLRLNKIAAGKLDLTFTLSRAGKPPIRINGIAAPNSPIFAAGMKRPGGIWIFGVLCDLQDTGIRY